MVGYKTVGKGPVKPGRTKKMEEPKTDSLNLRGNPQKILDRLNERITHLVRSLTGTTPPSLLEKSLNIKDLEALSKENEDTINETIDGYLIVLEVWCSNRILAPIATPFEYAPILLNPENREILREMSQFLSDNKDKPPYKLTLRVNTLIDIATKKKTRESAFRAEEEITERLEGNKPLSEILVQSFMEKLGEDPKATFVKNPEKVVKELIEAICIISERATQERIEFLREDAQEKIKPEIIEKLFGQEPETIRRILFAYIRLFDHIDYRGPTSVGAMLMLGAKKLLDPDKEHILRRVTETLEQYNLRGEMGGTILGKIIFERPESQIQHLLGKLEQN